MTRIEIINSLIKKHNYKTYLEIGVRNPTHCFNHIECELKHGVDPGVEGSFEFTYNMTSDDFFKFNENKYDIIFIDGLHIDEQVYRDILNSLNSLSDNGTIVLHDCNPPTIYHAREDYGDNSTPATGFWNGTTWKAIVKARCEINNIDVCVVDTDWSVGIIRRSENTLKITNDNEFYSYNKFSENRKHYLNLITPSEFIEKYIQPKITFITPSINRPTLRESVQSLLNQTNPNWECIIVYDGVSGIEFSDPRIKTMQIDKQGSFGDYNGHAGLVRNEALKQITTEWIGFLDDDDTLHPDYVKILFEKYQEKDVVIFRMKYQNGLVLPKLDISDPTKLIGGEVGISYCYKNKFKPVLFDDNFDGEDYLYLIKLYQLTQDFFVAPEITYFVGNNSNIPQL